MKAELLKIAGVKSETEFYKKFPSEEAFMKKHGKAVKDIIAKKAQVGAMIPNIESSRSNVKPIKVNEEFLYNSVADLTGGESYDDMMARMQAQAALQAGQQQSGGGGLSSLIGPAMQIFGGASGGGDMGGGALSGAMAGMSAGAKNGKKVKKAQPGTNIFQNGTFQQPNVGEAYSSPTAQFFGIQSGQSFGQNVQNVLGSDPVQNFGIPGISTVSNYIKKRKAQKENLALEKK